MTLNQIIKMYGFSSDEFKFVRHGHNEINPLETFRNDKGFLETYQSFQSPRSGRNFRGSKYIAVFAPYHGTQALFLGVWQVVSDKIGTDAPLSEIRKIKRFGWNLKTSIYHKLIHVKEFDDLSERLVIEWGKSTLAWIQRKDKEVISLFPKAHVREFASYDQTIVSWSELQRMTKNPTGNYTWVNALKAVNGIYCISNTKNGRLYVGSAYGKNGIWGRWSNYVSTKHGGNDQLIDIINNHPGIEESFQFSILEILPNSSTAEDAITKENLWKEKLGSKIGGYNSN